MIKTLLLFAVVLAGGCGAEAPIPEESDDLVPLGKADLVGLAGTFRSASLHHVANDIVTLQLVSGGMVPGRDGTYVRTRCYDTPCSYAIPQTDSYALFRSVSTGRLYLDFYSFTRADDGSGDTTPKIIDSYEVQQTSKTLKLRKTWTARWLTLRAVTDAQLCSTSGGTWNGSSCACPDGTGRAPQNPALGWATASYFVPGAGGCFGIPYSTESGCDDSQGSYRDDDANLLGEYCDCGAGRWYDPVADGCVALPY